MKKLLLQVLPKQQKTPCALAIDFLGIFSCGCAVIKHFCGLNFALFSWLRCGSPHVNHHATIGCEIVAFSTLVLFNQLLFRKVTMSVSFRSKHQVEADNGNMSPAALIKLRTVGKAKYIDFRFKTYLESMLQNILHTPIAVLQLKWSFQSFNGCFRSSEKF